jgi:hypothetical protein
MGRRHTIPGKDAVARGNRKVGEFSTVHKAGGVACWGWEGQSACSI